MARSDEAAAFFAAVYLAVQEIPPGKVTSYGHIAKLVGTPQRPRQVGVCLKHLSQDQGARSQPSGARNQAAALQAEGVVVSTGSLGELTVNFADFGWFPRSLPSEEEDELDDDDSE
ncbi:6-O-methylguanine DNA methyltransferase [Seiridium cupressi]